MRLRSDSLSPNRPIPGDCAFCAPAKEGHATLGPNRSPHLSWSGAPAGTRSFAVICHDGDVPSRPDDVNQEGRTIPRDLPRVDFFHWVLVDIPASVTSLTAGADSDGVVARGKPVGPAPVGVRGVNDYTKWFAADKEMSGNYGGYDGPCPPWNDERLHHYHFTVYALNVERLGLKGAFDGPAALKAMEGHILDRAELVGTYSLNPKVKA